MDRESDALIPRSVMLRGYEGAIVHILKD